VNGEYCCRIAQPAAAGYTAERTVAGHLGGIVHAGVQKSGGIAVSFGAALILAVEAVDVCS